MVTVCCDAIIHLSTGLTAQAKASKVEIYAAFDACAEKVEKQLRRYKRKLKRITNIEINQLNLLIPHRIPARQEKVKDSDTHLEPIIIAETDKKFPILSVKEAAEELEELKLPFLCLK